MAKKGEVLNIEPGDVRNIALVRLSAIGDTVMLVPVVRSLLRQFPDARLTWVIDRAAYRLLAGLEKDLRLEFMVIDKPRKLADYRALYRQFKTLEFDLVLAMQANFRVNLIYPLIRAPIKLGFDRKRARDGQWLFVNRQIRFRREHLLESFFAFPEALGLGKRDLTWELPVGEEDYAEATRLAGTEPGYVVINPAASKAERSWLPERYAAVNDYLAQERGLPVLLTGGPGGGEAALAQAIVAKCQTPPVNLVGKTSLKQLAALMDRARFCICPDTGPAHIAVAMGTPVIGLYAVAPPELSRPWLWPELVVDAWPQAVRKFLGEDPATVDWNTRVHDPGAMALIGVEDVIARIDSLLDAG